MIEERMDQVTLLRYDGAVWNTPSVRTQAS